MSKKPIKKYQQGGKPTTQDSLELLANSNAIKKHYNNPRYKLTQEENPIFYYSNDEDNWLHQVNFNQLKLFLKDPIALTSKGREKLPISSYYQNIDKNKYKQREQQNVILDLRAPMQLYDRRINPTYMARYENDDQNDPLFGDQINIATYPKLQVTPINQLTRAERIQRQKIYGVNPGETNYLKPKETLTKISKFVSTKKPTNVSKMTPKGAAQFTINPISRSTTAKPIIPTNSAYNFYFPNASQYGDPSREVGYSHDGSGGRQSITMQEIDAMPTEQRTSFLKSFDTTGNVLKNYEQAKEIINQKKSQKTQLTKYQSGGKASRADSIALMNNTKAIEDFLFKNLKKYHVNPKSDLITDYLTDADEAYKEMQDKASSPEQTTTIKGKNGVEHVVLKPSAYRIPVNKNQFYQRDLYHGKIDLRQPANLYDRRITPYEHKVIVNTDYDDDMHDNIINYYQYHPLQVTPFNMLTDAQKVQRQQMFGVNPGEKNYIKPQQQKPVRTITQTNRQVSRSKPASTQPIITNDPEVYKANQDSLFMYNRANAFNDYANAADSNLSFDEIMQRKREFHLKYPQYDSRVNNSIKPIAYNRAHFVGIGIPIFKKPSNMVYEDRINRMTSKGMPTPTIIPNERIKPDVIYGNNDAAPYNRGSDIIHYTDSRGKWVAQFKGSTKPGIRGNLYTRNPKGDYTVKYQRGGTVLPYSPEALGSGTPAFYKTNPLQPNAPKTKQTKLPVLDFYKQPKQTQETTVIAQGKSKADSMMQNLPKETLNSTAIQDTTYKINPGDTLWKIAKQNNTDVDTLKRNNPNIKDINKIFPGQELVVKKALKSSIDIMNDYRYKDPFELDELNSSTSNPDKIHLFESTTPTADYYVVEDKASHTANVFSNGKLITSVNTVTGKNKGDDLTWTTTGGKGKNAPILSGKGNMSTPAGMFRVGSTGIHHGVKSFQRSKVYEDYNIPSSVHSRYVPGNKEGCNITNGCTGISPEGINTLSKYVSKNTRWYILPEKETTGQYKLTGAGLSFISNDIQKLHSEHAKGVRDLDIQIPNHLKDNEKVNTAITVLKNSKQKFVDKLEIPTDTYDKLAAMTLGVMGRESGYGQPGARGILGFFGDEYKARIQHKNVSGGPYQIRATSVPKEFLQKVYGTDKVDYNALVNQASSTELVMMTLYDIYKNIAPRYKNKYPELSLEEITLAYYSNPQGVMDPTKAELRIPYAKTVMNNAKEFKLNYKI